MRQALEMALDWIKKQPEETPHSKYDVDTRYVVLREIEAALAQPEQKPVAQCTESDSWNCKYCRKTESCKALQDPRNFASPPQRKPLTDEDKAILEAVHRELDRDCDEGNAPGHSHRTKGVWDEDNGKLAGKPCAWCLTWAKFKTLIKNEAAHNIKE